MFPRTPPLNYILLILTIFNPTLIAINPYTLDEEKQVANISVGYFFLNKCGTGCIELYSLLADSHFTKVATKQQSLI